MVVRLMILCIDDEPSVLSTRKLVLQSAGFEVMTAANGIDGLKLFALRRPDVVVLDFYMPGMNGATVAQHMKSLDASVPILMVSACVQLPDEARDVVDEFLTKGERPPVMLGKLRTMLQGGVSKTPAADYTDGHGLPVNTREAFVIPSEARNPSS